MTSSCNRGCCSYQSPPNPPARRLVHLRKADAPPTMCLLPCFRLARVRFKGIHDGGVNSSARLRCRDVTPRARRDVGREPGGHTTVTTSAVPAPNAINPIPRGADRVACARVQTCLGVSSRIRVCFAGVHERNGVVSIKLSCSPYMLRRLVRRPMTLLRTDCGVERDRRPERLARCSRIR